MDFSSRSRNANKYRRLAPLAQDVLSGPASEAYVERVFSVCGQLTAGKRNRLTKSREKNHAENGPDILWINQQKNHTGNDCQSCTNDNSAK